MTEVAGALEQVRARIVAACARAGREPGSVELVAVSKLQPSRAIEEAYAAGQRHFGENYAQELRDKADGLSELRGIRWHAIGPLQVNKAKYVAKVAYSFHALDRVELAAELSKRRSGSPLRCFVQVHLGDEVTKSGVDLEGAADLVDKVRRLPLMEVVGLMALPPLTPNPEDARPHFRRLGALAARLGLSELSMGTTGDFEVAIEEGATVIRVGTAIFGERRVPSVSVPSTSTDPPP